MSKADEILEKMKYEVSAGEYSTIKTKDLEEILNYIDNSISKEVIEEKITKLERELKEIEKLQFNDYYEYIQTSTQTKIICLQSIITKYKELLEGK